MHALIWGKLRRPARHMEYGRTATRGWPAIALLAFGLATAAQATTPDQARWQREAQAVTVTRDDWGIAHVHGKTDADAVFGMIYAQAEDDFNRVETNYLNALGRTRRGRGRAGDLAGPAAEAVHRPGALKKLYAQSPGWLQRADGRLGRRAQLLPRHPSAGASARDHPLRAVDGAVVHRGQHRRRHRAGRPWRARGVLRRRPGDAAAGRGPDPSSWSSRPARTASRSRRSAPPMATRCC